MNVPQDNIYIKGDSIDLEFQLFLDKSTNTYWDLTNHQIRFQINSTIPLKKATANVTGGGDDQILITNPLQGLFTIFIKKTESNELTPEDYTFEIEITTPSPENLRYTVLQSSLRILSDSIEWTDK